MVPEVLSEAESKMTKSVDALKRDETPGSVSSAGGSRWNATGERYRETDASAIGSGFP